MSLMSEHMPKAWDAFCTLANETLSDGALSAKVKELMAFALSITVHCEPCIEVHLRRARQLGATDAEIAEAVAVTVVMYGGPAAVWPQRIIEEELGKSATSSASSGGCCGDAAKTETTDDKQGGCCGG